MVFDYTRRIVVANSNRKGEFVMNRNTSGSFTLTKASTGFINYKTAEGLAQRTLYSYERTLVKWIEKMGDTPVTSVTSQDVNGYLTWLRTEYTPERLNGKTHPLSPKSIRNVWITLSSFFNWASREFKMKNPMKEVPPPRFKKTPVEPFTQEDVEHMLKACIYTREADTNMRHKFVMRRPTANRDQAIILVLVDTGLRALELCSLKVGDVDTKHGKVEVKHGIEGGAKGGKGRIVYLGKVARRALWRYLAIREDGEDPDAPLFTVYGDRKFKPDSLRLLIKSIAARADVKNAYPHKFRHTFAITYLRSGGDIFTLQEILGHGSLDMVRHYAQVARVDVEQAHRKASPADNWRL
jgi:integrase/recombinase XerD